MFIFCQKYLILYSEAGATVTEAVVLAAAALDSIPPGGPLLCIIPPFSPYFLSLSGCPLKNIGIKKYF